MTLNYTLKRLYKCFKAETQFATTRDEFFLAARPKWTCGRGV